MVDFGVPNPKNVKGGRLTKAASLRMNSDFFWSSFMQGVSFGDIGEKNTFGFVEGPVYTIFSSGSSFIQVPSKFFNKILQKMLF